MTEQVPEFWPDDREMEMSEAILRLTFKDKPPRMGSVFVGDLEAIKDKDNTAYLQDFALLGLYLDYVEECRSRKPQVIPSFNSFPKYFGQMEKGAKFRLAARSSDITNACDRIERQFNVALFPRSYGVTKTNLGDVDLSAGQLRVDLPIKRETENPTPDGWSFGRLGQILGRFLELNANSNANMLRANLDLISTLTGAIVDTALTVPAMTETKKVDAYFDLVRTTTAAVLDHAERRVRYAADPRSFLARQAAANAVADEYDHASSDGYAAAEQEPTPIGRIVKPRPRGTLDPRRKQSLAKSRPGGG